MTPNRLLFSIPKPIPKPDKHSRILLWHENKLVSNHPTLWHYLNNSIDIDRLLFVATKDGIHYFTALASRINSNNQLFHLRELLTFINEDAPLYQRAAALLHWHQRYQYCSQCRTPLLFNHTETSFTCHNCSDEYYPSVSPCIIVLVTHGSKILLVQSDHQIKNNYHTTIAGYVESGESAEHAVHREVKEETNIIIENIRYINSQHWPFPNQLMLGFHADYKSGQISVDKNEIKTANWFDIKDLPKISPPISISHWLISEYINTQR